MATKKETTKVEKVTPKVTPKVTKEVQDTPTPKVKDTRVLEGIVGEKVWATTKTAEIKLDTINDEFIDSLITKADIGRKAKVTIEFLD